MKQSIPAGAVLTRLLASAAALGLAACGSSDSITPETPAPAVSLLASPLFRNATGNGANGWKSLGYADLAMAWERGLALQSAFGNINTDNPDLSAFKARNGKLIMYHGLADVLIPPQGSINYYHRVADQRAAVRVADGLGRERQRAGHHHRRFRHEEQAAVRLSTESKLHLG